MTTEPTRAVPPAPIMWTPSGPRKTLRAPPLSGYSPFGPSLADVTSHFRRVLMVMPAGSREACKRGPRWKRRGARAAATVDPAPLRQPCQQSPGTAIRSRIPPKSSARSVGSRTAARRPCDHVSRARSPPIPAGKFGAPATPIRSMRGPSSSRLDGSRSLTSGRTQAGSRTGCLRAARSALPLSCGGLMDPFQRSRGQRPRARRAHEPPRCRRDRAARGRRGGLAGDGSRRPPRRERPGRHTPHAR